VTKVEKHLQPYLTFPEDAGCDTRIYPVHRHSHAYGISKRHVCVLFAPISEAREIALRTQTAVSIATLLIIAICHKFWVIVTTYRSRGFIRGTVVCGVVEREDMRRCCWMHAETALLRVAAGNYDGAIYNVRLLHFIRKTDGILHQTNCIVIALWSHRCENL